MAVPHDGHGATRLAPHSAQNFRPSSFGVEHAAQITVPLASFGGTYPAANAGGAADESRARRSSRKRGLATPAAIPDTRREVRVHEPTITEQALRPGVVTTLVGVTFAAWLVVIVRMRGMDAGPGTDLGWPGWYRRHLGDDDGGDDAAVGSADGALVSAGLAERARRSARPFVPTWLFVAGYLAVWTAFGLVAYGRLPPRACTRPGILAWEREGPTSPAAAIVPQASTSSRR